MQHGAFYLTYRAQLDRLHQCSFCNSERLRRPGAASKSRNRGAVVSLVIAGIMDPGTLLKRLQTIDKRRVVMGLDNTGRQKTAQPDGSPFKDYDDVFDRLSPYHAHDALPMDPEKQAQGRIVCMYVHKQEITDLDLLACCSGM